MPRVLSRMTVPAAVAVTMKVYVIRKDKSMKMVLDIDGGRELPNAFDLQERSLLANMEDPNAWRIMTQSERADYEADLAREDRERFEFLQACEEFAKLHGDEVDTLLKDKFGWTGSGA